MELFFALASMAFVVYVVNDGKVSKQSNEE